MIWEIFVSAVVAVLACGFLTAWARRGRWVRWFIVFVTISLIPASYIAIIDILGRPKPATKEFIHQTTEFAEVLGYRVIEGQGLYILLMAPGWDEPVYYVYPWEKKTRDMLKDLYKKEGEAKRQNAPLLMRKPFDPWKDKEDPFVTPGLPPLPSKQETDPPKQFHSA